MTNIFSDPPASVLDNLKLLETDLDAKIPSKKLDKNLLIASWNIRAFGDLTRKWKSEDDDSPKRDLYSIKCIAAIIKRFDVIAIQEVKANIRALRDTIKVLGHHWSLILTDVTKGDNGNGERMAYLFDTRRVNLSGLACELVVPQEWIEKDISGDAFQTQFARTPYAVSFKSCQHTFILVTLHILYGKKAKERIPELRTIAKWLSDWASDVNAYHQNLITLGDFNIDERGDLLDETFLKEGLFVPKQLQTKSATRSIFNETKYYDQIAWFNNSRSVPNLSMEFANAGSYNFLPVAMQNRELEKRTISYMMSDHYPLWAEFKMC